VLAACVISAGFPNRESSDLPEQVHLCDQQEHIYVNMYPLRSLFRIDGLFNTWVE
jgi:hypothetical protein